VHDPLLTLSKEQEAMQAKDNAPTHTGELDHDLADALHDTHSSFIEVNAVEHVDGEPTRYVVMFSHRYSVAATSPVDALAAAVTGLRAAMGSAA
jgi:hypothetical protein